MSEPDGEQSTGRTIEVEVGEAIANSVGKHEHGMVTKWVAIIESIDDTGERGVWTFTSDGVKSWDTLGLLQYGLHIQQMQAFGGIVIPDDE